MNEIKIPGLERSDFTVPSQHIPTRIIASVQGPTKSGKSTFPFWGPGPIAVFDFDRRLETVVQRAMNGKLTGVPKEIVYIPFKMPDIDIRSTKQDSSVLRHAGEMLEKFKRNLKLALESSMKKDGVRTISIDTATELKDVRTCAEFGRLIGIQPRDLGGVNQDMRDWMRMGEDYNANVIWVHHVKDEWITIDKPDRNGNMVKDSSPSGRKILDGYNKAPQCVQVVLETDVKGTKFQIKVLASGLNPKTNNLIYTEADWSDEGAGPFAVVMQGQMPKTAIEEWMD
jgi:hypothetical protein